MAEFEIQINQSLVDKSLDNLDFNPLVLVDIENSLLQEESTEIDTSFDQENYLKESMQLVEDQYLLNAESEQDVLEEPQFIKALKLTSPEKLNFLEYHNDDNDLYLQTAQGISFATDFYAAWVVENASDFSYDAEVITLAQNILAREEQFNLLGEEALLFGGFFKRAWRGIKKAGKRLGRWAIRQVKKVVGIDLKNAKITKFKLIKQGRPKLKISNPIEIGNVNVKLVRLEYQIPYYIKWPWQDIKWRQLKLSVSNIAVETDAELGFRADGLKILTKIQVQRLKLKFKIIGVSFTVGLTGLANKILDKREFEIYDATNLVTPIKVKGLEYSLNKIEPVGVRNGLKLDVHIDVKKV